VLVLASLPANISPIQRVYAVSCDSLPVKIYSSGVWQWWINDTTTCAQYLANQAAVDLFFPFPDLVVGWFHDHLGGTNLLASPMILNLIPAGRGAYSSGGNTIGISIDSFYDSYLGIEAFWAYSFILQEFTNTYIGKTVSGGFPSDWWADDRSPFPLVTGVEVNTALNWNNSTAAGTAQYAAHSVDPQVVMFKQLYDTYGAGMFDSAFNAIRSDGIRWGNIASNPSALLTNYVAAYLMIGANANLTSVLNGIVPGFDNTNAQNIEQARTNLQNVSRSSPLWAHYLEGDYGPAFHGYLYFGNNMVGAPAAEYQSYNQSNIDFNYPRYFNNETANCFTNGPNAFSLYQATFDLHQNGYPRGSMYAVLYNASGTTRSGAVPGTALAVSQSRNATNVVQTTLLTFTFPEPYSIVTANGGYCISVRYTHGDANDWVSTLGSSQTPLKGDLAQLPVGAGSWRANNSYSMYFALAGIQTNTLTGHAEASLFKLLDSANVTSVGFYAHGSGSFRLAIYNNSNGTPQSLLWQSPNTSTAASPGLQRVVISAGTPSSLSLNPGDEWLVWQWNSSNVGPSYVVGSLATGAYLTQAYGAFPSTWSGNNETVANWAEYVNYTIPESPLNLKIVAGNASTPLTGSTVAMKNGTTENRPVTWGSVWVNFTGISTASVTLTVTWEETVVYGPSTQRHASWKFGAPG
jgi:hypothetical protein